MSKPYGLNVTYTGYHHDYYRSRRDPNWNDKPVEVNNNIDTSARRNGMILREIKHLRNDVRRLDMDKQLELGHDSPYAYDRPYHKERQDTLHRSEYENDWKKVEDPEKARNRLVDANLKKLGII